MRAELRGASLHSGAELLNSHTTCMSVHHEDDIDDDHEDDSHDDHGDQDDHCYDHNHHHEDDKHDENED